MFDIQLKVYASQGSVFDTQLHTEDVGFALSERSISALSTDYIVTICLLLYDVIGYIIFITVFTILSWIALTRYKTGLMSYRDNLLLSMVIIGGILVIFECMARCIVLGPRNSPKYLLNNLAWIFASFAYIFFLTTYTISKMIGSMFVTLHFAIFFMLIYHYSLSTFLLLLVYPTKVIIIVTYLITFVFTAIILCSVSLMMSRPMYVALKHKRMTLC